MSSFSPQTLRKLYHPLHHLWIRTLPLTTTTTTKSSIPTPSSTTTGTSTHAIPVEIGMTQRGIDDIGDISSLTHSKNTILHRGDDILKIEWDGNCISTADELYHTVWKSYSATTSIVSPISGVVEEVYDGGDGWMILEEDTVLVRMMTSEEEWREVEETNVLVREKEYCRIVGLLPPGTFAGSD